MVAGCKSFGHILDSPKLTRQKYTYPLYIFANFAGTVLQNVAINQIFHQQQLASIESSAVIKPNVDTVYSRVVLDLSKNDVVLTIPPISDRYWVYPVIDA